MRLPQVAGMLVTIGVVVVVDMRVDWLVPVAMLAGGCATFVVTMWEQTRS